MKFQRHINLCGYALDSIFKYKARTTAIIASLTISLMVLGAVVFVSNGLEKEAELSAAFAPDITVQILQAGRQINIPMSYVQTINEVSGVEKVVPRVWGYIYYRNRIYTVMGIDPINMPIPDEIGFAMESGRFLQSEDKDTVIVGNYFARVFALRTDDTLVLYDELGQPYNFTVAGIFAMDVNLYTADLIVIPINDCRKFFGISMDYATDLCVYVKKSGQTAYIAQQIDEKISGSRVLTRKALTDALITAYGARSGFVSVIWYILLLAVILVAWNQASAVSSEAQREVGILKALGFSTIDILEIRLLETLILGVLSASLGLVLAVVYDLYLGAPIVRDFMLGWASIYPAFQLPIYISLTSVITLYAVAMFPLLVGCVIPAWRSAITEPDITIRGV